MPLDVIPDSAPYPRSLLGWDGIDYRVISVDLDGRVIPAPLPLLFNYKDAYHVVAFELNAVLGDNDLLTAGPGADEILVITAMCAYNATTNITAVAVGQITGANPVHVGHLLPTAIGHAYSWAGEMVVEPGYTPWARFQGCAVGDDIYFNVSGYIMRTDW